MSASTSTPNLAIAITTTGPASRHVPEFETERLLCRPLVEEDWPEYHKMLQEEQTMINAGVGPMLFPRAARAYFDDQREDWASVGIFVFKIDDEGAEGEFIGTGGVYSDLSTIKPINLSTPD
jgi:RimJ/RimL family protein N-acetyltransferase